MESDSLKDKATSGLAWTTIHRFTSMGLSFFSGIILARLLTPDDFGCIGMLSIFMVIANNVVDGGFAAALIQKKRPSQDDYSTIFYWNMAMALLMYAIVYICAPLVAKFYKVDILCPVLRVQGTVLILNALLLIQNNQLRKQFKFKKIAIVTIATSVASLALTVYLAYSGYGVWALVAQNLASTFLPAVVYWITNKWRPSLHFSIQSFKELFGFGGFMFLTNMFNSVTNNIQGLLIGKLYNPATMGYYSKAQSTETMASTSISQILAQITLPLYSEVQHDFQSLINVIRRLTVSLAYLTFPMMFLLCLLAKPLFVFLYSAKWIPSVPYFQVLCIAGLAICLQAVNLQAIAAIGKSKLMFKWTIIKNFVTLILIVAGLVIAGIWGMLIGMVLQAWFAYIVNASLVSRHIGYKFNDQVRDLLPILALSSIAFIIAFLSGKILPFGGYLIAVIEMLIFIIVYFAGSLFFKLDSYTYFKNLFISYIKK